MSQADENIYVYIHMHKIAALFITCGSINSCRHQPSGLLWGVFGMLSNNWQYSMTTVQFVFFFFIVRSIKKIKNCLEGIFLTLYHPNEVNHILIMIY